MATSTGKETGRYVNSDTWTFRQYGSGMLDIRAALWVIYKGNYSSSTAVLYEPGESKSYNIKVGSSDTMMRVSLTYGHRVEYSDDDHVLTEAEQGTIGEVKLEVFNPQGQCVASCTEEGANLKVLQFDPRENGGTGTYVIKITLLRTEMGDDGISCGVAWR